MNLDKLSQKEKIDAQETLRQGKTTAFWNLIVKGIEDSIVDLEDKADSDDWKELDADQYKLENELLKAKKQYLKKLLEFPDTLIEWLQNPNSEESPNFDPYETAEEQ